MIDSAILFLAYMVKYPDRKMDHIISIYDELPKEEKKIVREALIEIDRIDELFVTVQ